MPFRPDPVTFPQQVDGQIGMCRGIGWVQLDRFPIARDSRIAIPQFSVGIPAVEVRAWVGRVDLGGGSVAFDGRLDLPQGPFDRAEFDVSIRLTGIGVERPRVKDLYICMASIMCLTIEVGLNKRSSSVGWR
jgi:hypothetical protein